MSFLAPKSFSHCPASHAISGKSALEAHSAIGPTVSAFVPRDTCKLEKSAQERNWPGMKRRTLCRRKARPKGRHPSLINCPPRRMDGRGGGPSRVLYQNSQKSAVSRIASAPRMVWPMPFPRPQSPPLFGRSPPFPLHLLHTFPQLIVLTFDDAINGRTMLDYLSIFGGDKFRNPNGCPVKGTFFVSHEWTDYDQVERIAGEGHEIASNSITHESLRMADSQRWIDEMEGQRTIISSFAKVRPRKIAGMRAPQLTLGGDRQFEAMAQSQFLYDNTASIGSPMEKAPFWPQTLDFRLSWPCEEDANCPESSFPGIWEVPLNQFHSLLGGPQRSAMLRGAIELGNATGETISELLQSHFERAYFTNRAPLVLTLNADFLQIGEGRGLRGLLTFMRALMSQHNEDVYFLTMRGLVEWMRSPKPLAEMVAFPWVQCKKLEENEATPEALSCEQPNRCIYSTPGLASPEHQMLTCSPCPAMFPWLGNPSGTLGQ